MGGIRKFRPRNPKKQAQQQQQGPYKDIVRENAAFERFYRAQDGLCPDGEADEMFRVLKTDLPASFRITGFRSQATALRDFIRSEYMDKMFGAGGGGGGGDDNPPPPPPRCLPWYPDGMAWQLSVTRKDIRRDEAYHKLHNFLISETESGNISRQETVSMLPPLVLDVRPDHRVLDMCAAPGSKTAQLIEAVHAEEGVVPEGLVVANDSDNSRCYMLVHQAKRLQSPCVIVTNNDASVLPNFKTAAGADLKFDRVLCDVPCSGDGTMRKNADIWPKWAAVTGNNLHGVQFRILKRGLEVLEVGGRLAYSTCSLNPVEDEAVIHRILLEAGDAVEVIDVSDKVEGLKYAKGIGKWKISGKGEEIYSEFSDVPEGLHNQIRPYMFAPAEGADPKLRLDRCIRVLPHQQDTGGFFVAVLRKNKLCRWESSAQKGAADATTSTKREQPPRKKPRYQGFKEDPFVYFEKGDPAFEEVREYFDIRGLDETMFLTRCKDRTKKNSLYFTSRLVRELVTCNEDRLKIINTGVKSFAKCENKGAACGFRLAQEGALMTIPFLNRRIVRPTRKDLRTMLLSSDVDHPPELKQMEEGTRKQLEELDTGSVAFVFEEEGGLKLEIVGWKGKASVRAYVPKNDRIHYLRLVGGDTSKFEKNKFEARREENEKRERDEQKGREEEEDDGAKEKNGQEDKLEDGAKKKNGQEKQE